VRLYVAKEEQEDEVAEIIKKFKGWRPGRRLIGKEGYFLKGNDK